MMMMILKTILEFYAIKNIVVQVEQRVIFLFWKTKSIRLNHIMVC